MPFFPVEDIPENLQTLCMPCNVAKGARLNG